MQPLTSSEMSGIFDIFKKWRSPEETASPPSGLPILAPEHHQETPGFIEQIRIALIQPPPPPTTGLLQRAAELFAPPAEPAELTALDKALQVFQPPPPPVMAPPPEAPLAPTIAEVLVPEPIEEELIEAFLREPPVAVKKPEFDWPKAYEDWLRRFPDIAEATGGRAPRWLGLWEPPTVINLARQIAEAWPDLTGLFEWVYENVQDPYWRRLAQEAAHTGEPPTFEVERVARGGLRGVYELARWLGVPEYVIELYSGPDLENARYLAEEVLWPMETRFTKAMDLLMPKDLKGWFELTVMQDGDWWIVYREAPFRPPEFLKS